MNTTSLGTIYLSNSPGTPVGRFDFVVDSVTGGAVEVGTLVTADTEEGQVVGSVVDMRTVGHDRNPTMVEIQGSARDEMRPLTEIPDVMVASVQVFSSPSMRPVRRGSVRAATAEEVLRATGYPAMAWPIPAGVVPLASAENDVYAKVCVDGEMLLGPESAHLTIGGLSGAAKTSYATVVLKSILANTQPGHRVGALLFNVKGSDLIYLDQPPEPGKELTDDDRRMYDVLGIAPEPFRDVTVYAPALPGSPDQTRSPRPDCVPLRWDLREIWNDLPTLLNVAYDDEKVDSFLYEFRDLLLNNPRPSERIDTFEKLENWLNQRIDEAPPETGMAWRSHHVATLRRLRRMLVALPARAGGLLTRTRSRDGEDIPTQGWTDGRVIVVDIDGLDTQIKGMVIGRTIRRLMQSASEGQLGVDHLIIMADELNNYAPAQGHESASVKRALSVVTSQGRYAGVTLFGLAQQLSKVDLAVVENAATRALGVSTEIELGSNLYGRLPAGLAERLSTIPKGQMALWHQAFRSAMVISFPRPAWRGGKSTTTAGAKNTPISVLKLRPSSLERLTEGLEPEDVDRIITLADDPDAARDALEKARIPDVRRSTLHEPSTFNPADPFALDDE